ncbi:MAG: prepilin peptidase [Rhodothermales bacterium]|nr:prepilin peptidase [Rhodothermales bacterium]
MLITLVLLAAALLDARTRRIPNLLTGAVAVLGMAMAATGGPEVLGARILAGLAAAGCLGALRGLGQVLFGQPGMGLGDVKLAGSVGLLAGWSALWGLYLGLLLGGFLALIGLLLGVLQRDSRIPFAPFFAAGALAGATILPPAFWL